MEATPKRAEVVLVVGESRSGKGVLVRMLSNELKAMGCTTLTFGVDLAEESESGRLTWLREALRHAKRHGDVDFIVLDLRGRRLDEGSRLGEEEMDIVRYARYVVVCTRQNGGQLEAWRERISAVSPEAKIVASLTSVFPDPAGSRAWWVDVGGVVTGKISHLDEEAYAEGKIPTVSKRIVRSVAKAIVKAAFPAEEGKEEEVEEEGSGEAE